MNLVVERLRRHPEERLNAHVVSVAVREIDYVRETTRAQVRYALTPRSEPIPQEALDGPVALVRR
jgi:hypothetical protein